MMAMGGVEQAETVLRTTSVTAGRLELLEEANAVLRKRAADLYQRLEPVLRPEEEIKGDPTADLTPVETPLSPIADRVRAAQRQVEATLATVEELLARLEV